MADWDVVGTAPAQVQNPWAVRKIAPPTFAESQNATAATHQPTGDLSGALSGLAELFGTSLANIPGGAMHGIHDIVSRATGNGPAPAYKPDFVPSPNAQAVGESISQNTPHVPTVGDLLNLIPGVKEFHDQYIAPVKQDVGQIGAGASIAAPALSAARAGMAGGATETGIGLQSAGDSPFLAGAAGPQGLQVLSDANRAKATTALGARAGVPHGTDVNLDNLEAGRAPADAVGQRAAAALPTGPINGDGATQIENAGPSTNIVTRSDAAQATIDTQKHRLLNSTFSGDDVMANLRSLRKQGYARIASENPEDWDIGHAQLDMARGLETHIDEQLNASNANVSMDQIREARVTQAQNSALQAAMKGSNIDFAALARMSRADPDKFTGVFKEVADFANDHPKVMQLPAEIPPSFRNDLGNAVRSAGLPQDVAGRIFGALGVPAGARRLLTGGAPDLTAAQRTPVAGLGGEFAPIQRTAAEAPGAAIGPTPPPTQGGPPATAVPTAGITATPIEPKLGDIMPGQRGAVGEPVNIGPLRALQNQPQTYKNGPIEIPKGAAKKPGAANDKKFGPFKGNPQTLEDFLRENLGDNF